MDIREFSEKLAEATKDMSPEEREALKKMFEGVTSNMPRKRQPRNGHARIAAMSMNESTGNMPHVRRSRKQILQRSASSSSGSCSGSSSCSDRSRLAA